MMLATSGLLHYHKGKAVKTSDIHSDETENIFEYSFTASIPGIISVKGFEFFSHAVQV